MLVGSLFSKCVVLLRNFFSSSCSLLPNHYTFRPLRIIFGCYNIIMILIIPTTFYTYCVRVSIQIRANIILFFINSMYNIKPLNVIKGFMLYTELIKNVILACI
jgi:hypothetical protein